MKKTFGNTTNKIISLLLLGFILFSFLHSELDFFNYDHGKHDAHDYCKIVNNTTPNSKSPGEYFHKLELKKVICPNCFGEVEIKEGKVFSTKINLSPQSISCNEVYLFNKTLLI